MSIPISKKRGRPSKPVDPNTLGGRIRAARERAGLTTVQLGARIGVADVTVTLVETGKSNPARRTLILLAQVLEDDFGVEWLREMREAETGSRSNLSVQDLLQQLPPGVFDKVKLKDLSDEDAEHYLHVIKDAIKEIEAYLTELVKKRRTRGRKK
jgi:transcriptional regulator with XRE-family HTH domain